MSLVPANINVTIIANYTGNHRVCYRIGSSGPYNCVTVNCAGGGAICTVQLPILVDNETCPQVQFNGYVQPMCIDIASTDERVAFSQTFTPTPSCGSYTLTCVSSGVAAPTIISGGTEYNPMSPPSVIFTGGAGTGVIGTAVVGAGAVTSVPITNAGSGYTNGIYTNVDLTGGTGSGAKGTVTVSGGVVVSVVITSGGTGYATAQVLGVDYTDMGMGAPPAVSAQLTIISNYGKVVSITITNAGVGYTTAPTITIGVSGGIQATATGNLAGCPLINSTGCNGVPAVIPANILNVGDSVSVCNIGGAPTVNSVYSVVSAGNCLCNGVLATIGVTGTVGQEVRYIYNRNNGGIINGILTVGGSPSRIIDCIVPNSLVFQKLSEAVGTISYGGAC